MKRISLAIATVFSFALFGAGCASQQSSAPQPQPVKPGAPSAAAPSTTPVTANMPTIDETWKTYNNAALKFAFQYPTKGKYAPTWNVSFVREGDVQIKDGCMLSNADEETEAKTLQVGNVSFCHSAFGSGAAGSFYMEDYYVTKNGNQYVVITFTKKLTNSGTLGCANANENPWTLGGCAPFSQTEYRAFLDQVVSTFVYQP